VDGGATVTGIVARRFLWLVLTLWAVFTVTFFLMRAVPGGPFSTERKLPEITERAIAAKYRLDDPLLSQYRDHLGAALRGDLGPSFSQIDYRVGAVIAEGLPKSLLLGGVSLLLALFLGGMAGWASALRPRSLLDTFVMGTSSLGLALPNFVIASLLVMGVAFPLSAIPVAGWGGARHLILPSLCLSLPYAASIARLLRTGLLEACSEDWFRTARAKGWSRGEALRRHALRPGSIAVVSYLGPAAAGILTGSLVIEQVFAIPGVGSHFVQAALDRDYPLAMGVVLLYSLLVGTFNLVADLAVLAIDPRGANASGGAE
jgi:oligopeptide transport system permease protein